MIRRAFASVLVLSSCAGPQGTAESPASNAEQETTANAENAEVERIAVGDCTETPVAEGVKKISSTGAGWSYLVPTEAQVQCTEFKAVLAVGTGLSLVVTSYRPLEEGAGPQGITELMVKNATEEVRSVDSEASVVDIAPGTFGAAGYPGHCGGATFHANGEALRSVVCSVSATASDGAKHVFLAAITDTEAGFREAGITGDQLFSQLVDNWTPSASTQ